MNTFEPTSQHQWLGRLIGDWTWSHDAPKTDNAQMTTVEGTETYRAIGPLWVQGEAVGPIADGGMTVSQTTLTFDPATNRFAGTWVGSMMPYLWIYDGELDASGRRLSLYSKGPSMDGTGGLEPYLDVIEFIDDNTRTLTGHTKDAEGRWKAFMTVEYRRR
jgi:hypothetical protein